MLYADDQLVLCDVDREMMEIRQQTWIECMENVGLQIIRAKIGHLQTTGDTDPSRMK